MASTLPRSKLRRFLRGGFGCLLNLLIVFVGGTSGIALAGYYFGPSMLAGYAARALESKLSQGLTGMVTIRELSLGWGPKQQIHGVRLIDEMGNLLLEGDVTVPSPWRRFKHIPIEVDLTGGRLNFDSTGVLNLARVVKDKASLQEGFLEWVAPVHRVDLNLRVLEGGRGLEVLDETNPDANLHITQGQAELSLDWGKEGAPEGSLRVLGSFSDGTQTAELDLALTRETAGEGLSGNIMARTVPGHWVDTWLGTSGEFAAWIEDVFSLSLTLEAVGPNASTVSLQLSEPVGTRLSAAGTLDDQGLRLRAIPGACRISAQADLLIGELGELLQPQVEIEPTTQLDGRLTEGGFYFKADSQNTRLFFSLVPDSFPSATFGTLPLPAEVSNLWVDFHGTDRRAALRGSIQDPAGRDSGRFNLDLVDTSDSSTQAILTLSQIHPSLLESWWRLPHLLIQTLGETIDASFTRTAVGEALTVQLKDKAGQSLRAEIDEQALRSLNGAPLDLLYPLDQASFASWVQPLIPWLNFVPSAEPTILPVRIESFSLPQSGDLKELEMVVSLDFAGISLEVIGVLDQLLAGGQSRAIPGGLADPVRLRISGGELTYEGFTLPLGGHEIDAEGTLDLVLQQCRVALEMPLDILHQRVLGATKDFPRAGLASMSLPVEFTGRLGAERLQVDVSSLLTIREFLEPLLARDG